jgi:hypothetical protein
MPLANNVTAKDASLDTITFTTDAWNGDPSGASQMSGLKVIWGSRGSVYNFLDDVTGQRLPVKLGEIASGLVLPVSQSGSWSTGRTWSLSAGGDSVTVTGTVGISGTVPVSGSVSIANFPATQPISAAALPLPANAAQETGGNLAAIAASLAGTLAVAGAVTARIQDSNGAAIALGQALAAASLPMVEALDQVTLVDRTLRQDADLSLIESRLVAWQAMTTRGSGRIDHSSRGTSFGRGMR